MARPGNGWLVAIVLGAAACSFDPRGAAPGDGAPIDPDAAELDAPEPIDAGDAPPDVMDLDGPPLIGRTLVDDTAADFGQGSHVLDESRIEATGAVAPRAYYVGSLCAGGSSNLLFTDGDAAGANGSVLPATPARTGLPRTVDLTLANSTAPPGVGVVGGTDWTLWWYGELFLTAGAHTLALRADDHGFLEVQAPGEAAFTKLIGVNYQDGEQTVPYAAPVTGWYGLRLAVAQRDGVVELAARLDGQVIGRRLTRCRVDGLAGLAETAFDQSQFLDLAATAIQPDATAANVDWGTGGPNDLGLTGTDTFSVRWAGQVLVELPGTYRLRVRSDDGFRLWIAGTRVLADTSDGLHDLTTGDLVLARGWHDVVLDVTESTLGARASLTVASGPELVGQAFPPARLRPAEGRFERFESVSAPAIGEPGPVMFGFDPAPGAIVTGVDVGYVLDIDDFFTTVTTTLRTATTMAVLRSTGTSDTTDRFHPVAFDNLAFATAWGLGFTIASGGGSLLETWLTVHHRDPAGTGPTPLLATYESSIRDLLAPGGTTVASIDLVTFDVRAAVGATITIALRTCDAPAACAAEPYSTGYTSGAVPTVPARRYLQYRLDLATDGDHEPAVERVQLDYRTQ